MIKSVLKETITWKEVTPGEGIDFIANVRGQVCKLRMNDFPEEPLYTLTVGDETFDLDDPPETWHFPWKKP